MFNKNILLPTVFSIFSKQNFPIFSTRLHKISQDSLLGSHMAHESLAGSYNFWHFRFPTNFNRAGKIFFLNRFQKFQKFWKAMILIRSFLLSKSRMSRLRHPLVPILSENFAKITIWDAHHPTLRKHTLKILFPEEIRSQIFAVREKYYFQMK